MEDQFGSDFMTIVDEDGTEFELEVLSTLEYNGFTYLAVIPAGADEEEDLEVSILKSVDEDGEPILCGTYWQNFDGAHSGVSFEVPLDLPAGTSDAPAAPLGELGEGLD